MSHPDASLAVRLERMAAYHIIPIEAAPSRLRPVARRDVQTGVLLTIGLVLCFTPWAIITAIALLRDHYYLRKGESGMPIMYTDTDREERLRRQANEHEQAVLTPERLLHGRVRIFSLPFPCFGQENSRPC
ncbi:hypothetical protein OVA29_15150 [Exiguobacterium sp. SL14]|nr:hypothetical protein [Exiguobacterium sp. SL14]MCY1691841.1 hypothetical protein [Exiguobacterium sp. SL14]